MQRFVETDHDDDGFTDEELTFTRRSPTASSPSRSPRKAANLSQYVEAHPRMQMNQPNHFENIPDLGDLDLNDDHGTVKKLSKRNLQQSYTFPAKEYPDQFEEDDVDDDDWGTMTDNVGTLRRKKTTQAPKWKEDTPTESFDDGFDDGFDFGPGPLRLARTKEQVPALDVSDTDRSPSRHSHSSSVSSVGSALTESLDADDAFDFQERETPLDLKARFAARQLRAKIENSGQDVMHNTLHRHKQWATQFGSSTDEDEFTGLDLDKFDMSRGTVNRNVMFGTLRSPRKSQSRPNLSPSRLRPAQSHAQLPQSGSMATLRPTTQLPQRRGLRPAKSMYDIAGGETRDVRDSWRPHDAFDEIPSMSPRKHHSRELSPSRHGKLAMYQEIDVPHPKPSSRRKKEIPSHDDTSSSTLQDRRRRKIGLIRNPGSAGRQEVNGMVYNPSSGVWEGNESELSRFDTTSARDNMLIPLPQNLTVSGDMVFDHHNLCWLPKSGQTDDDPFAEFPDDDFEMPSRVARASTASFASSLGRRETSAAETFVLSGSVQRLWRDMDARFVRKFGRWISHEGEVDDGAYDIYKMVH